MTNRTVLLFVLSAIGGNANVNFAQEKSIVQQLQSIAGDRVFQPYATNPILRRGEPGSWDEWAVGSMSVVKAGNTFHMYYEGWGSKTIEIGHATSPDGIHWQKDAANPVIPCASEGWDSGGTWDPFVIFEDGLFKMWYGATPRGAGRGNFQWGYAESKDGSHFERRRIISHIPNGEVEDDHIVRDRESGHYYMYFWDRNTEPAGLFRAESANETDFDFDKAIPLVIDGLDRSMMHKFTHVVQVDGAWYMLFGEFIRPRCLNCRTGLATSTDGVHWKVANHDVLVGQDGELLHVADDLFFLYYGPDGFFDGEGCDIRVAVMRGHLSDLAKGEAVTSQGN